MLWTAPTMSASTLRRLAGPERDWERFANQLPVPLWACDSLELIVSANDAARALLCNGRSDIAGAPVSDLVGAAGYRWLAPVVRAALAGHSGSAEGPIDLRGTTWISVQAVPGSIDSRGGDTAVVAIRDLTRGKQMETELLHLHRMEAIARLTRGISHDFNNLLMGIRGGVDIVLDRMALCDPNRDLVAELQREADRGAALAQRLSQFVSSAGTEPDVVSLDRAVAEAEPVLQHLLPASVMFRVTKRSDGVSVRCSARRLQEMLISLALNARDAMPRGGRLLVQTTTVTLEERDPSRPPGTASGAYVALSVTDTGLGMDEQTAECACEPFFTTKSAAAGNGLGLWTVYGIVRAAGGGLRIESTPGIGTSVVIYLPIHTGALSADERAVEPEPDVARGGECARVLLVEDEPLVRRSLQHYLERGGFRVAVAESGRAALEIGASGAFDILVTDVLLPGMSGPEVARELTRAHPSLPVLFVSAYTHDMLVSSGVLNEDDIVLQKPLAATELLGGVRRLLGHPGSATSHR
jgi:signal transduction histidine kinase